MDADVADVHAERRVLAVAAFAGYALRVRQEYVKAAEARAVEAERTRESEAQRRVEEERVRIAREVHDITAHSLSAVSIKPPSQSAWWNRTSGGEGGHIDGAFHSEIGARGDARDDRRPPLR